MKQSRFKRAAHYCGACSGVAITAVLAASPAAAQNNSPASLDEVVVTARKVAENLQDVPVAVTAFTGEDLQKQNAVKVTDVGRMTPGIAFRQSSNNPSGLLVSMRGQFQRDQTATLDPSVGTYVDGVYWARAYGLNADLVDLESVQVLKGPQGTLFGRNTTGGAVLLQTNDPQYDRISGLTQLTYGRFNERTGTVVLNLPIVQDRVALRGALQIAQRDGYLKDVVSGREFDNRDNVTGRLKLGIKATDNLNLLFSAERFRFNQAGTGRSLALLLPASDPRGLAATYIAERGSIAGFTGPSFVTFAEGHPSLVAHNSGPGQPPIVDAPGAHYETETYTGTGTLDTGIGTFKLIGAYRGVEGNSKQDIEGSPWTVHTSSAVEDLEQYSVELQLTGKAFNDAVDYVGGLFWFKENGLDGSLAYAFTGGQNSANATIRASAAIGSLGDARINSKSQAVYGQAVWRVTQRLSLTGGLRYSVDDKGLTLRTRTVTSTGAFLSCGLASLGAVRIGDTCTPVTHTDQFSSSSYLASADYRVNDDVMVYAKTSKGYRSGGQNARALTPGDFKPFGPEVIHDIEGGVKSELLDRRLRLNLAAYRSTIDGAQRSTRLAENGITVTRLGNAAQVRVWGVEAEATAVLGGGFRVTASGAITKPKYLSYSDLSGDRRQERFNGVPQKQFALAGDYSRDLGFADLALHADYSWAGKTPLDEINSPTTAFNAEVVAASTRPAGGEANVRGSLSFQGGRYELAAFGRNIFDNRDRVVALTIIGFGYIGSQYREPATFGIQGTWRFGQ